MAASLSTVVACLEGVQSTYQTQRKESESLINQWASGTPETLTQFLGTLADIAVGKTKEQRKEIWMVAVILLRNTLNLKKTQSSGVITKEYRSEVCIS